VFESESKFSSWLTGVFNKTGFDVTRIESHGTGNGIPDMFVQGVGRDMWIELKNEPHVDCPAQCDYKTAVPLHVKWRPGQQAWARAYILNHVIKSTLTIVALNKGFAIIPMYKQSFKDNYVDWSSIFYTERIDPWTLVRLSHGLEFVTGKPTFRDCIIDIGNVHPDVDYDPEVLFDAYCPGFYKWIYNIDDEATPVLWNYINEGIKKYFELAE
jgi:hypothetical protein